MTKLTEVEADLLDQGIRGAESLARLRVDKGQTFTPSKEAEKTVQSEPQMKALRRILGPGVLETFPSEVVQSVHDAYAFWKETPDSFLITDFDSPEERVDAEIVLRAVADCITDEGMSIATRKDESPVRLIWRAQNRRAVRGSGK